MTNTVVEATVLSAIAQLIGFKGLYCDAALAPTEASDDTAVRHSARRCSIRAEAVKAAASSGRERGNVTLKVSRWRY